MTPEEEERLRKQRKWEAHLSKLTDKKVSRDETEEEAQARRKAAKREYDRAYREKVRLNPLAYQHRLEQNRERCRRYREAHKDDPAWIEKRREYAREWNAKPGSKQKRHEYYLTWKEKHPEKHAARVEKNRERRKAKKNGSSDHHGDE